MTSDIMLTLSVMHLMVPHMKPFHQLVVHRRSVVLIAEGQQLAVDVGSTKVMLTLTVMPLMVLHMEIFRQLVVHPRAVVLPAAGQQLVVDVGSTEASGPKLRNKCCMIIEVLCLFHPDKMLNISVL